MFWLVKDGLLAELQAKMSSGCRFLLFWHHSSEVTLIQITLITTCCKNNIHSTFTVLCQLDDSGYLLAWRQLKIGPIGGLHAPFGEQIWWLAIGWPWVVAPWLQVKVTLEPHVNGPFRGFLPAWTTCPGSGHEETETTTRHPWLINHWIIPNCILNYFHIHPRKKLVDISTEHSYGLNIV